MVQTKHKPYGIYERFFKRALDVFCSLLAIVVFWWLFVIVAVLVRVKLGSPVLFTQDRPGKDEKIFKLYKFRTMTDDRDENGNLLPDDVRLTKFGRLLRSTSLDELPEVFNILKGDMSIIGPRPLLVSYLPYYTEKERHRHDVRPGLTGWAQINGRNVTGWDQRLQQDLDYVNHCSFIMDVKIVLMTVLKVVKRSDILVGNQIPAGRLDVARRGAEKEDMEMKR
ncbi:sugar transferase [Pseudoflavonifractor sp. SW1122]|uniref:sugar transferase n=1 Tax=Pseudoflavonifractor sp. SW1122 TaxID=2530044 RepID=UPI0016AE9F85|nr:sugar transferase [Pseudoflavonifractor sp. SW1122]NJE73289.1 sugar transferase [Pseudoflavonifractor sp. SW1122]